MKCLIILYLCYFQIYEYLSNLDHSSKNVMSLLGYMDPGYKFDGRLSFMLMAASLNNYCSHHLCEEEVRISAVHLITGAGFLHSAGLVHCDIKPDNILVGFDGVLKICDLGTCDIIGKKKSHSVGTKRYQPPELQIPTGPYFCRIESDMYSVGLVLAEVSTGLDIQDFYHNGSLNSERVVNTLKANRYSDNTWTFLSTLLKRDKKDRFSALEALEHEYIFDLNEKYKKGEKFMTSLRVDGSIRMSQCLQNFVNAEYNAQMKDDESGDETFVFDMMTSATGKSLMYEVTTRKSRKRSHCQSEDGTHASLERSTRLVATTSDSGDTTSQDQPRTKKPRTY